MASCRRYCFQKHSCGSLPDRNSAATAEGGTCGRPPELAVPAASGRARGRLGRQLTPVPKQLPSAEQTVIGARCLLLPFCRPFLSSVPTAPDFHPSPPHRRRLLNSSPKLRPRHFFFPASATATVCAARARSLRRAPLAPLSPLSPNLGCLPPTGLLLGLL